MGVSPDLCALSSLFSSPAHALIGLGGIDRSRPAGPTRGAVLTRRAPPGPPPPADGPAAPREAGGATGMQVSSVGPPPINDPVFCVVDSMMIKAEPSGGALPAPFRARPGLQQPALRGDAPLPESSSDQRPRAPGPRRREGAAPCDAARTGNRSAAARPAGVLG